MVNKALVGGIIGFLLGGLVVSGAATFFENPKEKSSSNSQTSTVDHNAQTTANLKHLTGDEFDKAFMAEMIMHHEGAIDMAKLIGTNAKHEELTTLGQDIITAQTKEIDMMKAWQAAWGYKTTSQPHDNQAAH